MNNIEFLLSFNVITNFAFIVFAICRDIYFIKDKKKQRVLIEHNSRLVDGFNSYCIYINKRIDKLEGLK